MPQPRQKIIHVHGSDRELGKVYIPEIGIHAGPNAFVAALTPVAGDWSAWRARARADYEATFDLPPQPSPVGHGPVMAHLQRVLPPDAI